MNKEFENFRRALKGPGGISRQLHKKRLRRTWGKFKRTTEYWAVKSASPTRKFAVWDLKYSEGLIDKEIGELVGLSGTRINQYIYEIYAKLFDRAFQEAALKPLYEKALAEFLPKVPKTQAEKDFIKNNR